MKTHAFESRRYFRHSVVDATDPSLQPGQVDLATQGVVKRFAKVSSADAEMSEFGRKAREGDPVSGFLRVQAVTDGVFRIRYTENDTFRDSSSPILTRKVEADSSASVDCTDTDCVLRTLSASLEISSSPFRLTLRDADGHEVTRMGGPEKNQFGQWDATNTSISRDFDGSPLAMECIDLHPHEAVYGFGERFTRLNLVGQRVDLIMDDALGPIGPRAYKNIPLMVSTRGYGIFFHHHNLMSAWVGASSGADIQVAIESDELDYFILTGSIQEILAKYTALTGAPGLPPDWSFGYWQSKFTYHSAEETLDIARRYREKNIPCDVLHLDTDWFKEDWYCDMAFDPVDFPNPKAYFKEMADMGFKISLWHLPYIPEGSDFYNDLLAVDGFLKTTDGDLYDCGICFTVGFKGKVGVIDFTNPAATKVYKTYCRKVLELGARCLKTDFGEQIPLDTVAYDGSTGAELRNLYPLLYNQAAFEITEEVFGEGQGMVWGRSAWAGSQRFPMYWGGDIGQGWANLGPQLAGGLSFGLSGNPFWSHDIGGFLPGEGASYDLILRWYQFGMMNSHSRNHGFGEREIDRLPEPAQSMVIEQVRFRYRLLPYILGTARNCIDSSVPFLRAMVIDFQNDPSTWDLQDQYLFGEQLLFAPLFNGEHQRSVYLPEGEWTHWFSGETFSGKQWVDFEDVPLDEMLLFLRDGAVIPLQPDMAYVGEKEVDTLTLRLTPFRQSETRSFTFPINGKSVTATYTRDDNGHRLSVTGFDGTINLQTPEGLTVTVD